MIDPDHIHLATAVVDHGLQVLVDAEAAIAGEACILRVELPHRGLVWKHVAGGLSRGGEPATEADAALDENFPE